MTKKLLIFTVLTFGLFFQAHSKPMDTDAGKKIPALRKIISSLKNGINLSNEDNNFLSKCIESKDPVLLSAAAWIVGEYQQEENDLSKKIKRIKEQNIGDMPKAFIEIAVQRMNARKLEKKWVPSKAMKDNKNMYMRAELVRHNAINSLSIQSCLHDERYELLLSVIHGEK